MSDVANDFSVGGIAPELFVRDLMLSLRFYERTLGFRVVRQTADFAVLALGDARVHLAVPDESIPRMKPWLAAGRRGIGVNVRIIAPDVDALYERVRRQGAPIAREIGDRTYGLRDFTIADPDGFVLSFASPAAR